MDKPGIITYSLLSSYRSLLAFSTTRKVFPGADHFRFTGDHVSSVAENRRRLAALLGIQPGQLVFPRQTHSGWVAEVKELPEQELTETDGLVTNRPGICLCVQTADCVSVLLFDPVQKAIAAIHAGWRGTVKRIAGKAVRKMQAISGSKPGHLRAVIGPSIGPAVYEVGPEVVREVERTVPNPRHSLWDNGRGSIHFNLWEANRQILLASGLTPNHIEVSEKCTFREETLFFSARREGKNTGRMVSGIMLLNAGGEPEGF